MKNINFVKIIAAVFVLIVIATTVLGIAFQTPKAGHAHAATIENSQAVDHSDHDHAGENSENPFVEEAQLYTCSMHPHFRSEDPNERCPICGMELVPVARNNEDSASTNIEFSERSLALLNVQTQPVVRKEGNQQLRVTGQLEFDERALTSISAWTGGRIERLYINFTGASVNQNDPLVEIYSPELLVAQQELLQAQKNADTTVPGFLQESNQTTLRAARERLRLLGLTQAQIDAVVESGTASDRVLIRSPSSGLVVTRNVAQGDYVNAGDSLFELADNNKMWAVFEVFERDLALVAVGQHIEFALQATGSAVHGEIISVSPRIDADRRTREVRVAIDESEQLLTAGAFTSANIQIPLGNMLMIPASAPLVTGKRAVVYVRDGEQAGSFSARTIELGRKLGDSYEVLSGLSEGELVVSRGAFLIDSELQLRGQPSMMAPEGGGATGHEHHGGNSVDQPAASAQGVDHSAHNDSAQSEHTSDSGMVVSQNEVDSAELAPVFAAYHKMWGALQNDNLADWQTAATDFHESVAAVNWPDSLNAVVEQLSTGAGHAHHVASISTARNQFHQHSQAMIALAEAGYHEGELHVMFCPMARSGQGASWLQQDDELLNPYYGAMMLRCGDNKGVLSGHDNEAHGSDDMGDQRNHDHGGH
ncbi:efflux RND transporter periplasmic adaptor subunit [Aliidiomarina shirensis]|uniref:Efflux RND transporter periplasmic adaptor subunit n=1 Tax=Aliidiomarina shirensis TaxID=1048642 RepID=A0A432WST5_9GAMM|nr:efflux RND transporter periplasmic adaptor subunit [Aliidiomarina shirensis]RUO36841.1 efflux RND transporter periplasmic adaptor subunit [Aliidiomarina shirensis]